MLISDVLHTKGREVITVRTTDKVSVAVQKLAERRIGALVVEDRWYKPTGIFSERDLVRAFARHGPQAYDFEVHELMTSPFFSAHLDDRIDAALGLMTMKRIRHLPVLEGDELVGLVSIGDLVKYRLDEKELEANVLLEITRMRAYTTALAEPPPCGRGHGEGFRAHPWGRRPPHPDPLPQGEREKRLAPREPCR